MTTALMAQANVAEGVLRAVFARVFHILVHLDREVVEPSPQHPGWIRYQVTEISSVSPLQGAAHEFTVEPLFLRDRLGAPLRWTGAMPPDDVRARDDLLVFLALEAFGGRPKLSELPDDVAMDVRALAGTYKAACAAADELLFSLADDVAL